MDEDYRPFRNIRSAGDLLLARQAVAAGGDVAPLAPAFYAELCAWVTLDLPTADLFGNAPRVVMECDAWRLMLTEHGYLGFESDAPDAPSLQSYVPAHVVTGEGGLRLGVALCNQAWALRATPYFDQAASYSVVRLLAGGAPGPLSELGEITGWLAPGLAPVPESLRVGLGPGELTAYNALEANRLVLEGGTPAEDLLPLVPGGSSFEPRRLDDRAVEVFTRPEFTRASGYWVLLHVREAAPAPERLIVRTTQWGGANMTPTFFASPDREQWRRVAPVRVTMVGRGAEFSAEFAWPEVAGQWLASAPPFGDPEREALLAWAQEVREVEVREIGASVEGRPIHALRLGAGPRGVVITCGQHSPLEIMGGRIMEPMIRALLECPALMEATTFVFVPTVNVDCAHYGGNGANVAGRNLNRHWLEDLQPETRAVVEYVDGLRREGLQVELGIDVHAGGIFRNHVLMHMAEGEVQVDEATAQEQEVWRDLLERHAGLRRADSSPLPQGRLRAGDWLYQEHGAVGFCLEFSTCSYFDPHIGVSREFGVEMFGMVARGIVEACRERFCG